MVYNFYSTLLASRKNTITEWLCIPFAPNANKEKNKFSYWAYLTENRTSLSLSLWIPNKINPNSYSFPVFQHPILQCIFSKTKPIKFNVQNPEINFFAVRAQNKSETLAIEGRVSRREPDAIVADKRFKADKGTVQMMAQEDTETCLLWFL